MDFENIEIGLLNRNSTLPSKESVLERFQDGLASRLRASLLGMSQSQRNIRKTTTPRVAVLPRKGLSLLTA